MGRIACAHPGKLGDALYALPTVRALAAKHGTKVDFYTSTYCRPLFKLLEYQSCIDRVVVPADYRVTDLGRGVQPWEMPVPAGYEAVYQLGLASWPEESLPNYVARRAGLSKGLPITYEYEPRETLGEPYIVIAPQPHLFPDLFLGLVETCPIRVVEVGARGEGTGSSRSIDMTGLSMLDTLPWIAGSLGFVGVMSAMLVLANGFPIPKVSPHDGEHWDMRHVVRSPLNHYPVRPSAAQALGFLFPRAKIVESAPVAQPVLISIPVVAPMPAVPVRRRPKPRVHRPRGRRRRR